MLSHSFHQQLYLNILCSSTQLINTNILYPFLQIQLDANSKIKRRPIEYLVVFCLKELTDRQQNTEAVAITATAEKPNKQCYAAKEFSVEIVMTWQNM